MTTLRAVAIQALEALWYYHATEFSKDTHAGKAIAVLQAALAEPETCTWWQDGDCDSGVYQTSCRRYFNLEDGTPEDNKMRWCCYCGKKLAQELIVEDGDD